MSAPYTNKIFCKRKRRYIILAGVTKNAWPRIALRLIEEGKETVFDDD
jgi:hypothetical protein